MVMIVIKHGKNMVMLQTSGITVFYDPMTMLLIILFAGVTFGLLMWWIQDRQNASIQSALVNAQINALNTQTAMMANLTQAMVTAINTNTAIYERIEQHMMDLDNRYLQLYQRQVDNDIYFKNTLLELYGLQLTNKDLMELLKNRVSNQTASTK